MRKHTVEGFMKLLKGRKPITRKTLNALKTILKGATKDDLKSVIDSPFMKGNLHHVKHTIKDAKKHEETAHKSEEHHNDDGKRLLQEDYYDDWYSDEEEWWNEYDEGETTTAESSHTEDTTSTQHESSSEKEETGTDSNGLPIHFDGRDVWGRCIHPGGDQGDCDGCWAFGIANHLSDRFCIMGKDVVLSPQDVLECTPGNSCCEGGTAGNAYEYMMSKGTVSQDCKPYDTECGTCRNVNCERYKCEPDSLFWAESIQEAKREIYENGPIEAVYDVFDDFPYYESGIYYKTSDKLLGVHTVEVLGWGKKGKDEYWLCKNGWGDSWGDRSFFKIRMGECGIEDAMTTCRPQV